MKLSILTGTYNRGELLKKLYKSILKNINYGVDIEWLIMDDGSSDDTKRIVENYIKENKFEIKYFKQENKGKMNAINTLVELATGDLIMECDSDDYLKENALLTIKNVYDEMDNNIYALCFLKYDQNECNIGNLFKQKDNTMFDLYFKQGENGDKALVFNANIRKQYKYELEKNERFVTEARMHYKMDLKYKIKCFNEPIMICEYREDGYSKNIVKTFKENPYGYYQYFKEMFEHDMKGVLLNKRLYAIKHYILFSTLINAKSIFDIDGVINKILLAILYLPGKIVTKIKFK